MARYRTSTAIGSTASSATRRHVLVTGLAGMEPPLNNCASAVCCTTNKLIVVTGPRFVCFFSWGFLVRDLFYLHFRTLKDVRNTVSKYMTTTCIIFHGVAKLKLTPREIMNTMKNLLCFFSMQRFVTRMQTETFR